MCYFQVYTYITLLCFLPFAFAATLLKTECGSLPEGKVRIKLEHDGTILDVDEDDIEKVSTTLKQESTDGHNQILSCTTSTYSMCRSAVVFLITLWGGILQSKGPCLPLVYLNQTSLELQILPKLLKKKTFIFLVNVLYRTLS